MLSFLATDHWYDLRDLANLYRVVLEGLDHIFPTGLVISGTDDNLNQFIQFGAEDD